MAPASLLRAVLTTTLTVVAVAVSLVLVYLLRGPLTWLVIAAFVALALAGPVSWLTRRGWSRGRAMLVVYLAVLLVPILLLAILVPPIARGVADLVAHLPEYAQRAEDAIRGNDTLRELDDKYDITGTVSQKAHDLPARLGDAAQWLGDLGAGAVNSIFALVTILIFSVFLVANGGRWVESLIALQPPERADRLRSVADRMAQAVGAYIAGALLQAVLAGVTAYVVLLILGVPYAAPLAVVVGLFDLIPMVGATLAAVIVGIVTLFANFPVATILWVVWAIVYQQLENALVQPRIQNRAVGVHPFGVMVAVLFGGTLLGIPGAVVAVPVAAMFQIAFSEWRAWQREHRPPSEPAVEGEAGGP